MEKPEKSKKNFSFDEKMNKWAVWILGIVSVAIWIPFAITKNVAYDQGYTVAMVQHGFGEIVKLCSYDVHSPLYYFIAKIFYELFFRQIFGLKICSLFFSGLYIWMLAVPFRREFGNRMAFCMIALSAMLPTLLTHNTEPRMYSMALAFYAAVAFLGYKIIKELKNRDVIWFFIVSVGAVYIHTYTMVATVCLYLAIFVAILVKKEEKKERKKHLIWFFSNAVAVSLAYLPWLFSLVSQFGKKAEIVNDEFDTWYYVKDILYEQFSSIGLMNFWHVGAWLAILAVSFVILFVKKSRFLVHCLVGLGIFVFVGGLGTLLSVKVAPCFLGRYVSCITPLLLFAIAAAVREIDKKWAVVIPALVAIVSGISVYRERIIYEYDNGIDMYLQYANENFTSEDAIIYADLHNDYLSIFKPEMYSFILGHRDDFNPFYNDEVFTDFDQLRKIDGNVYLICFDDKNPDWFLSCEYVKTFGFHYLYYDVSVYRLSGY